MVGFHLSSPALEEPLSPETGPGNVDDCHFVQTLSKLSRRNRKQVQESPMPLAAKPLDRDQ
jgi:hypothetical protein